MGTSDILWVVVPVSAESVLNEVKLSDCSKGTNDDQAIAYAKGETAVVTDILSLRD